MNTPATKLANISAERAEAIFWRQRWQEQIARLEGIGHPTDLAGEWAYRDAEYARDEALKYYRQYRARAAARAITEVAEPLEVA